MRRKETGQAAGVGGGGGRQWLRGQAAGAGGGDDDSGSGARLSWDRAAVMPAWHLLEHRPWGEA